MMRTIKRCPLGSFAILKNYENRSWDFPFKHSHDCLRLTNCLIKRTFFDVACDDKPFWTALLSGAADILYLAQNHD